MRLFGMGLLSNYITTVTSARGGSNHNLFWIKYKKNDIPQFHYIKVGFKEVYFSLTCFPDVNK